MILLAAHEYEARPTIAMLSQSGRRFHFIPTGIGSLQCCENLPAIKKIIEQSDDPVVYLGTCGLVGDNTTFSKPYLMTPFRSIWLPPCLRTGISYSVPNNFPDYDLSANTMSQNAPSKKSNTDTGNSSSFDFTIEQGIHCGSSTISLTNEWNISARESKTETYYENLELYSLMHLTREIKSFGAVLGVTNAVGPNAHRQWAENRDQCHSWIAEYIAANLAH